jgi:hypothetical protein
VLYVRVSVESPLRKRGLRIIRKTDRANLSYLSLGSMGAALITFKLLYECHGVLKYDADALKSHYQS